MNTKNKKAIILLSDACKMLGWDIALPPGDGIQVIGGLVIGDPDFLDDLPDLINREGWEVMTCPKNEVN